MPLPSGEALFRRLAILEERKRREVAERGRRRAARTRDRRQRARWRQIREARKGPPVCLPGGPGSLPARMLRAMEPGQWYGRLDLVRLIGVPPDKERTTRPIVNRLLQRRQIERQKNPQWDGHWGASWGKRPVRWPQVEPMWLYRLSGETSGEG